MARGCVFLPLAAVSLAVASFSALVSADLSWREALTSKGFRNFAEALESTGAAVTVDQELRKAGARLTFLAPNDDAVAELVASVPASQRSRLASRLLFHVVPLWLRHVQLRLAADGAEYPTLWGKPLYKVHAPVLQFGASEAPYGPSVERWDAYLGEDHVISVQGLNSVIDPSLEVIRRASIRKVVPSLANEELAGVEFGALVEALRSNGLSSFWDELTRLELVESLRRRLAQGGLTLLVPQGGVLSNLPRDVQQALQRNPQHRVQLLLEHVLPSRFPAASLQEAPIGFEYKTLSGSKIVRHPSNGLVYRVPDTNSKAAVTQADAYLGPLVAVHFLDSALIPRSLSDISYY